MISGGFFFGGMAVCLWLLAAGAPGIVAANTGLHRSSVSALHHGPNTSLRHASLTLPQCTSVHLAAAYLAQSAPGAGPGFLLTVSNDSSQPVRLARPVPTSVHWYAQAPSGRLLWRASSGSGGGLADALRENGPLLVYRAAESSQPAEYVTVPAHSRQQWAASIEANPVLRFRPGCERCSNPEDKDFLAVLAYAYLPPLGPSVDGLLACGLRSGPVVMPPLK